MLLDIAAHKGVDWLEPGAKVTGDDLDACRAAQGVDIGAGDILLVRTGWFDLFALTAGRRATLRRAGSVAGS